MGWALVAGWATVAGLLLLTIGTSAQAWASLSEYRNLFQTAPESARDTVQFALGVAGLFFSMPAGVVARLGDSLEAVLAVFRIPHKMTAIRQSGGEDAARLAQLLRLAGIWSILMAGSVLALTGATIGLALTYTS